MILLSLMMFFSGTTYTTTITAEGTGQLTVGGKQFTVTYVDDRTVAGDEYVLLNYPDTTTAGYHVVFPTIETSKGAKVALYQPLTLDLDDHGDGTDVARLYFPDGDGYTYADFVYRGNETAGAYASEWNITIQGGTASRLATDNAAASITFSVGQLTYELFGVADNSTIIYVQDVAGNEITLPGVIVFEEKDDSTNQVYNAMIVKMEGAGGSDTKVGVSDVEFTWGSDAYWDDIQLETDNDLYKSMDYYGAVVTTDKSDSDSYSASISYPNEQVYPLIYVAEESATITPGSSGSTGSAYTGVVVTDSEVSTVSSKNLIIVGGSCINSAAATLVGGSYCGSDWTTNTDIGSGQFLIKGYATSSLTSKMALLVAGYNKEDTVNAATFLRTKSVDTSKAYKGTSSTSADLIVEGESA
jgi:hypothetical protein